MLLVRTSIGRIICAWANGSNNHPDPFNSACPGLGESGGPKICLSWNDLVLTISGGFRPGTAVTMNLSSPSNLQARYQIGSSLRRGPIRLGPSNIGLALEALLIIT